MYLIIYKGLYIYIYFVGCVYWAAGLCSGGSGTGMGAGHPPHELVSSVVNL